MKNRIIGITIFGITLIVSHYMTNYFGSHWFPESPLELSSDILMILMYATGFFVFNYKKPKRKTETHKSINIETETLYPVTIRHEEMVHVDNLSKPGYRQTVLKDMASKIGFELYNNKFIEIRIEENANVSFLQHENDCKKITFLVKVIPPKTTS